MALYEDEFSRIIDGCFDPDEQDMFVAEFEERDPVHDDPTAPEVDCYSVEPLELSRAQLLEIYDNIMDAFTTMRVSSDWEAMTARFVDTVLPNLDTQGSGEVMVRGARSFMSEDGLGLLDGSTAVIGDFHGFIINPWYNLPFDETELENRWESYRRDSGLHVVLGNAQVEYPDGSRDVIGDQQVPLNHGYPELYRVLRQG